MPSYTAAESLESSITILDLLKSSEDYERHIERFTSGILFRISMGKRVQTGNEDYVRFVFEDIHRVEKVASPGANLCDPFPVLWKLPSWIYPFKRQLAGYFEIADKYYRGLQDDIAAQMRSGTAVDCWQKRYLENKGEFGMNDQQASWAVGTMLAAGMPTTAAALLSFLQAMVHHPEWQAKMQREVDDVVGGDRLPDYSDMPRLPTIRAVLKETLRWRPVTAGGLPHMLEKDDVYEGYFLPKGSIVHANQW